MTSPEKFTIAEASKWASDYMASNITPSNISYLVQYGQVRKLTENGTIKIYKQDLLDYYNSRQRREQEWKALLGDDLNWALSFEKVKESETTKHVHRLHPYKGKFIPQLVEYFLDTHTDSFKTEVFFNPGDIILDPFCGSGTTLVQASELGIHAIGIEVSEFNALLSNVKVQKHHLVKIEKELRQITRLLEDFGKNSRWLKFEDDLSKRISEFNTQFFPSPQYKYQVKNKTINQKEYAPEKERAFLQIYDELTETYGFDVSSVDTSSFLSRWYISPIRHEIELVHQHIEAIEDKDIRNVVTIILSRTIRSCRATTHVDLATLREPVLKPYYCRKHFKICKPLLSMISWWKRYSSDTIQRLKKFDSLRTETHQICITGDARNTDLIRELECQNPDLAYGIQQQGIKGIFSSPPYVGLIDYHEQHAYAYELFGFERRDEDEIGTQSTGKSKQAQERYVRGIADALTRCQAYMVEDFDVFLVANDDNNLYPRIAALAGLQIVNEYKRPVLNRTEKDRSAYSETIFHMK